MTLNEKSGAPRPGPDGNVEDDQSFTHKSNSVNLNSWERKPLLIDGLTLHEVSWRYLEILRDSGIGVYQKEGVLVHVVHAENGWKIEPLTLDGLRHYCSLTTKTLRESISGSVYEIAPRMEHIRDAMATPNPPVDEIKNVLHHPVVTYNGKIISEFGYNKETGFFIACELNLQVNMNPTSSDVTTAVSAIEDILSDFQFSEPNDMANFYAMLITPFIRNFIEGPIPGFLVRASIPGTGKSLLADVAFTIWTGHRGVPSAWPANEEELQKSLIAVSLSGAEFLFPDNISQKVKSPSLAAALSSGALSGRLLGQSKTINASFDSMVVMTGNNPDIDRELARRIITIKLSTDLENPSLRTGFKYPDLLEHIKEHREELLGAILTIIRGWAMDEYDTENLPIIGSFESWSKTIGGILRSAGIGGFLADRESFYSVADSDTENWRGFLTAWYEEHKFSLPVSVKDILDIAARFGFIDERRPEGSQRKSLGRLLAKKEGVIVSGLRIKRGSIMHGMQTWEIEEVD